MASTIGARETLHAGMPALNRFMNRQKNSAYRNTSKLIIIPAFTVVFTP
jgi:hypothetical protein